MKRNVAKIRFLLILAFVMLSCESESDSLHIIIRNKTVITDNRFALSDTKKENINANFKIWLKNTFIQEIEPDIHESENLFLVSGYFNYIYNDKEFIIYTEIMINDNELIYKAMIKEFYMDGDKLLLNSIKYRNEAKGCLTQVVKSLHDNFGE